MIFLACYDDNPKKAQATKLAEAVQSYQAKLGAVPNLVLVNEADAALVFPGCEVRAEKVIRPNTYHVGRLD